MPRHYLADNDRTSLHYAVIRNDKPLFEALSAYQQLDASAIDTGGRTPLHYAVMSAQLLLVLQFLPSDLTDLVMWTLLNGFCSLVRHARTLSFNYASIIIAAPSVMFHYRCARVRSSAEHRAALAVRTQSTDDALQ